VKTRRQTGRATPPLPPVPFSSLSPIPSSYHPSPPLPSEVGSLNPARGSGERCKLPERGLGRSPSRNRFWCIVALKSGIWWQGRNHGWKVAGDQGFGPNTEALAPWGGCGRGLPPPAVGVRGCYPRKIFENSDAKSCILEASALISGLPRTCISQQTTSMSRAKSVPKFQLFSRGCVPGC